ncbi:hypothetical protein CU048_13890 [Beijerinckiaceae bacterium]|nr:hypothetical protein CU048_13890 [Beijerinckiaceae bacterium]
MGEATQTVGPTALAKNLPLNRNFSPARGWELICFTALGVRAHDISEPKMAATSEGSENDRFSRFKRMGLGLIVKLDQCGL